MILESFYDIRIIIRSGKIEYMRFYEICDLEIIMFDNYRIVKQMKLYGGGMFFMNWFLKFEEKIYIRGFFYFKILLRESCLIIKIGLINIDFEEICEVVQ